MIGNNACGAHSVAWGTTAENVRGLRGFTYGGEAVATGTLTPAGASGGGGVGGAGGPGAGDPRGADALRGLPASVRDPLRALVAAHLAPLRTGFPDLPRRISGYALDALLPERGGDPTGLLVGSEGTLALVTEAELRLVAAPAHRALAVVGFGGADGEAHAADAASALAGGGLGPLTVEGMAADLIGAGPGARALLPPGTAWLFVEAGGATRAEAEANAAALARATGSAHTTVVGDPAARRALWRVREDAAGTATRLPDGSEAWPGWEDCAVPPARLGAYLRDFRALLAQHGLRGAPYGHFGEGCVHVRIDFDLLGAAGVRRFRAFSTDLADLVAAHGGSLSGEHGDGRARAELLPRVYGPALTGLFAQVKDAFDPANGLNPGVLARPDPLDEGLRFTVLPARAPATEFTYPDDGGDLRAAVRRCVGVAKCRTTTPAAPGAAPAVMCPSFRATGDETHSTRGRARLLHEMLAGEVVRDGWRSTEVRDALDLCLSCKGCRSDCPVGVDMATYKAEFLHHHYRGRLRPRAHYVLGSLPVWLRAVSALRLAGVVGVLARWRGVASLGARLAGLTGTRALPAPARRTFTAWFRGRAAGAGTTGAEVTGAEVGAAVGAGVGDADGGSGRPGSVPSPRQHTVMLWPDTFTEHLSPEVGAAAVRVLEAAGLRVVLPDPARARPCCGLTWVSTGRLDRARAVMRRTLDTLAPALEAGLPVVVLEPSCAAALRTDLPELLGPAEPRAARLAAAVRTFAEALAEYAPDWRPPRLDRAVAGQTHCHQHAVLGDAPDRALRAAAGLTGDLASGCCGLAGNFGFEPGHEAVSTACAEETLLPSIRAAAPGTAIQADGFSCRTQLAQHGVPGARHLAQLLAEGL
jgi:Fe-S oxidoreductase/FAD/FMN-containing dehydrogenase